MELGDSRERLGAGVAVRCELQRANMSRKATYVLQTATVGEVISTQIHLPMYSETADRFR